MHRATVQTAIKLTSACVCVQQLVIVGVTKPSRPDVGVSRKYLCNLSDCYMYRKYSFNDRDPLLLILLRITYFPDLIQLNNVIIFAMKNRNIGLIWLFKKTVKLYIVINLMHM